MSGCSGWRRRRAPQPDPPSPPAVFLHSQSRRRADVCPEPGTDIRARPRTIALIPAPRVPVRARVGPGRNPCTAPRALLVKTCAATGPPARRGSRPSPRRPSASGRVQGSRASTAAPRARHLPGMTNVARPSASTEPRVGSTAALVAVGLRRQRPTSRGGRRERLCEARRGRLTAGAQPWQAAPVTVPRIWTEVALRRSI